VLSLFLTLGAVLAETEAELERGLECIGTLPRPGAGAGDGANEEDGDEAEPGLVMSLTFAVRIEIDGMVFHYLFTLSVC